MAETASPPPVLNMAEELAKLHTHLPNFSEEIPAAFARAYSGVPDGWSWPSILALMLAVGIVSIPTCFCYGIPSLICGALAVIFYFVVKKQIDNGVASPQSKSMAVAGLITGLIGLATVVVWVIMFLNLIANMP